MPGFSLDQESIDGVLQVSLVGELDMAGRDALRRAALGWSPAHAVVMDLARLTFIDSAGMMALKEVRERLEGAGQFCDVANAGPTVSSVFRMCGLEYLLEPSLRSADA
jgi:anti-anti-sigma factor